MRGPIRVSIEEAPESHELVGNPFHVIQTINAEDDLAAAELPSELLDLHFHLRRIQCIDEVVWGDADRHSGAIHATPADRRGVHTVRRDLQRCELHARALEMTQVVVHVEAQEVRVQKTLYDLLPPGQRAVDLGRRERRVQEPSDVRVRLRVAEHLGHEHQVVVVDPHIIVVLVHLHDRLGEQLVRLLVRLPLPSAALVHPAVERRHDVVEQGPQHVVGKTVVVVVDDVLGQKDREAVVLHRLRRHELRVLRRHLDARPAEPHHVEAALDAGQARDEASRAFLKAPVPLAVAHGLCGEPIRNHQDLLAALRVPVLQLLELLLLEVLLLLLPPDVLLDHLAVLVQVPGRRQQGRATELHTEGPLSRTSLRRGGTSGRPTSIQEPCAGPWNSLRPWAAAHCRK
mmetsp:Transcript_74348/g.227475  ORF Transcript_74348/g.227475 Transcript_74348/m.227475 type:complete len:401 (+) Transcript_74348:1237-2439(+)